MTSLCFLRHSSSRYLYAPMVQGLKIKGKGVWIGEGGWMIASTSELNGCVRHLCVAQIETNINLLT